MSGETLCKASARLHLQERCDVAALKRDLEKIAADLRVDVSFAELSQSNGQLTSVLTRGILQP